METPDNTSTQPGAASTAAAPGNSVDASSKPATAKPAAKPARKKQNTTEEQAPQEAENPNPQTVEIWPLRSYQDAGEIKRRGGKSYSVPKRHADALIARGLATDEQPASSKATK
ncbi:hypothetical protein [Aquipseudomonas campi]